MQVAGAIASAFEAHGIPGYLAVASSIQESNLNPDARQNGGDSAMGLFQSFPTGAAGGQAHRAEVIKAFSNPGKPVTNYWPATHQIIDAVGWWAPKKPITNPPQDWTKRAQGAGDPNYGQNVASHFAEARQLIQQYQASGGDVRNAIVANGLWGIAHEPQIHYSEGGNRLDALGNPRQLPLYTDCSAWCILCYKWANAPDPTGSNFIGNTNTLLGHLKHISQSQVQPGDIVIFSNPDHAGLVISVGQGGIIMSSHGAESGPIRISVSDESRYHSGPITYLKGGM